MRRLTSLASFSWIKSRMLQGIKLDPRFLGATVDTPDSYALVGCSVAPGFDDADFEMAQGERLCKEFPQHAKLIARLTR
jgi:predicted cupin superfamily sugar epimerase